MNKNILLVTPFFAPQTHAAVFRAFKLAKYLPQHGWNVHVVTVDTNYNYNEDPNLLSQLPKNVTVHRARYIEPTFRGLRMALGGKDRTFKAMKSTNAFQPKVVDTSNPAPEKQSFYQWILKHYLNVPDAYQTWIRPALGVARQVAKSHDCKIVYTTCVPYSCNVIGSELQKDGMKWVADFRDAPTFCFRTHSDVARIYNRQREIERHTLFSADVTTGLSSTYNLILSEMYNLPSEKEMRFIPTGIDDAYIPQKSEQSSVEPYVIFVGEYLREYSPYFFEVFAKSLKSPELTVKNIKLKVVGNRQINEPLLRPILEKLEIENRVEISDHVDQSRLYKMIQESVGGVILSGSTRYWWTNFAKLVDYIGLKKPVFAAVSTLSESRRVLTDTQLGIFLDGNVEKDVNTFVKAVNSGSKNIQGSAQHCRQYLASEMAASFNAIFERLL